jgi:O-6-methylguanine DNA methyltransferase
MFGNIKSCALLQVSLESLAISEKSIETIQIGQHPSPLGPCRIALARGNRICHLSFSDKEDTISLEEALQRTWPDVAVERSDEKTATVADALFNQNRGNFRVLVRGTDFQLRVWQALLKIPVGSFITYGELAKRIGSAGAARAVGRAVGANPVALLIPCHRVVRGDRQLGGYRWGPERKRALLISEQADLSALAGSA